MDYFRKTEAHKKIDLKLKSKIDSLEKNIFTISEDVQIDDTLFNELCPTFCSLRISNRHLTDEDLGIILRNSPYLKLLQIWDCNVTFEGLTFIQGQRLKLKYLDIQDCRQITDQGLALIAEKFPYIEVLTLDWCGPTSIVGFQAFVDKFRRLINLNLDMCDVSQEQIKKLVERCPLLVSLYVEHADTLRKQGLEDLFNFLSEKYPHLELYFH